MPLEFNFIYVFSCFLQHNVRVKDSQIIQKRMYKRLKWEKNGNGLCLKKEDTENALFYNQEYSVYNYLSQSSALMLYSLPI